jgi:hypothetical protein
MAAIPSAHSRGENVPLRRTPQSSLRKVTLAPARGEGGGIPLETLRDLPKVSKGGDADPVSRTEAASERHMERYFSWCGDWGAPSTTEVDTNARWIWS